MRRIWWALLVFVLVAAACGHDGGGPPGTDEVGGEDDPEAQEPEPDHVTIVSDDGDLAITAPRSVADVVDLEIVLLDPADWPEEVAGGENLPGVKVYDLLPDGATFDEPVVVTRKLDLANFDGIESPFDVPLVSMVTRGGDGVYELLGDLTATRVGSSLLVSGSTSHFTELLTSNDGFVFRFDPRSGPLAQARPLSEAAADLADLFAGAEVGLPLRTSPPRDDEFFIDLSEAFDALEADPAAVGGIDAASGFLDATGPDLVTGGYLFPVGAGDDERDDVDFFRPLILQFPDDLGRSTVARQAFEVGTTGRVSIDDAPSTRTFLGLNDGQPPDDFEYTLRTVLLGTLDEGGTDEPPPPVAAGPGTQLIAEGGDLQLGVTHQQFEEFASFIFWLLTGIDLSEGQNAYAFLFDPTVPLGQGQLSDVRLCDAGSSGIECRTGINSFGPYGAGMFFLDDATADELVRILDEGSTERFWVFAGALTDVECVINVTDTTTGEVRVYDVGPEEGAFASVGDTEAFAPCGP